MGSRAIDIGEILKENDEMILIPFEHLKKLKELFDAGILTEEEFIEEKAKLLHILPFQRHHDAEVFP